MNLGGEERREKERRGEQGREHEGGGETKRGKTRGPSSVRVRKRHRVKGEDKGCVGAQKGGEKQESERILGRKRTEKHGRTKEQRNGRKKRRKERGKASIFFYSTGDSLVSF